MKNHFLLLLALALTRQTVLRTARSNNMKSRVRRFAQASSLLLSLFFAAQMASAQVGGGSIVGNVVDANQAVIANATVTVTNVGTNEIRIATTNDEGYYEFPLLPAGRYVLEVQAANFEPKRSEAFDLNTGTRPRLDFTLGVAGANERVTVTDTGQLVNATNTELGVVIERQKIDALPLNGRDFQQLVGLQAGAQNAPAGAIGGRGGIEFNGGYAYGNNILLDGVDASFGENNATGSDAGAGAPGGGTLINTVSVDAIQEFKTTSSAFSAEYGRATGGVLNVTTKSGTNDFRGTLLYFLRNDVFDANTFDNNRVGIAKPALRFNQFGGNLGGPLSLPRFGEGGPATIGGKNRLFFFFNYEGARVKRPAIQEPRVPTPFLIAQVRNPALRQQLEALPDNCTRPENQLFCFARRNDQAIIEEDTTLSRIDANSGAHRLAFRYSYNNQDYDQPTGARVDSRFQFPTRFHNLVAQDTWSVGPNALNEIRVGFNRLDLARANSTYFTEPGFVEIPGLFGSDFQSQLAFKTNTYSFVDNFTLIRGQQTIKFGADVRLLRSGRFQDTNPTHFYNTVQDLINDNSVQIRVAFGGDRSLDSDQYAFYLQDDIRVSPRLQINPGLRYEYYTPLEGGFNIQSSDPFGPISTERNAMFRGDKNNFAPRLGAVYDFFGDQRLVARGGVAVSYQPPQPFHFYSMAFANPRLPFDASFFTSELPAELPRAFPFPRTFAGTVITSPGLLPARVIVPRFVTDYNRDDEESYQWNISLQYAVTPDLAVQTSYVGNRSINHPFIVLPNECLPGTVTPGSTCVRPNPSIGTINYLTFAGRNRYDAGQLSVNYRLRRNFALDFYYTYAKALTYGVPDDNFGNGQGTLQDATFDIRNSYGPKQSDIRHRAVFVHTAEIPPPSFLGDNGAVRALLGGFSLQGIVNYRAGLPFNLFCGRDLRNTGRTAGSRPDYIAGVNPYLDGDDDPTTFFNPAAFTCAVPDAQNRYGNLGYNALRGPSFINYDASIIKRFRFTETQRLDFRAEFFNAFNSTNLAGIEGNLSAGNFGRVFSRTGARNIQFGLKYFF